MDSNLVPPVVLAKLLNSQLEHRPDLLPYTVLQAFAGLRPEEAYRLLAGNRSGLIGSDWLVVAGECSPRSRDRMVRLSPVIWAWLARVPGWDDPQADLRPKGPNGQPLSRFVAQALLVRQLRRMGWQGRMNFVLRRTWITACLAVGLPEARMAREAGTALLRQRFHQRFDRTWSWPREWGQAWFAILPPPLGNKPDSKPTEGDAL